MCLYFLFWNNSAVNVLFIFGRGWFSKIPVICLEVLTIQHLRRVVPAPEVLLAVTSGMCINSVTLSSVIWMLHHWHKLSVQARYIVFTSWYCSTPWWCHKQLVGCTTYGALCKFFFLCVICSVCYSLFKVLWWLQKIKRWVNIVLLTIRNM